MVIIAPKWWPYFGFGGTGVQLVDGRRIVGDERTSRVGREHAGGEALAEPVEPAVRDEPQSAAGAARLTNLAGAIQNEVCGNVCVRVKNHDDVAVRLLGCGVHSPGFAERVAGLCEMMLRVVPFDDARVRKVMPPVLVQPRPDPVAVVGYMRRERHE